MANKIDGTFSIGDVLILTKRHYGNRFEYMKRDKIVGHVKIKKIVKLNPDRPDEPTVKYQVQTTSTPQYYPYVKVPKSGRFKNRRLVTRTKHTYDITLEMDVLNLTTTSWRMRLGSEKKWVEFPPQRQIRQIYAKTRKQWSKDRIKKQRDNRRLPINVGDWNAQIKGINGDFYFRCSGLYKSFGHLFGRSYESAGSGTMFFPKHVLALILLLMERNILKK